MEWELGKPEDMDVFLQQNPEGSLEEMSKSPDNSKSLLHNNATGVQSPVPSLPAPYSATRPKRRSTPPPVPERTDLIEKGFVENHSKPTLGKQSWEMPEGRRKTTSVTKRPVPRPRQRRVVSSPPEMCNDPSAEIEQKLSVTKPSLDIENETSAIRQQHRETKATGGSEFDPDFNIKSKNGSMEIHSQDFSRNEEQALASGDDGQALYFKLDKSKNTDTYQPLNQSRTLPDGSETPDDANSIAIGQLISLEEEKTENCYHSLKFANDNLEQAREEEFASGDYASIHMQPGQVQVSGLMLKEDSDRPPPLPRKDILSRSPVGFKSRLSEPMLPSPFAQDFDISGSGNFPPSYLDQVTETQTPPKLPPKDFLSRSPAGFEPQLLGPLSSSSPAQNFHPQGLRDQNLDGLRSQDPSKRPLPSIPGIPLAQVGTESRYDKCRPGGARSNPIPLSRPQMAAEGQSKTSRPLPPVPSPSLQPSAEAIFLQQSRSSSFSLGKSGEKKPVFESSSELEQPIYDIPLPPVPLPPTIPKEILNQPPPDSFPFRTDFANSDTGSENKVEISADNSTDINGNVTSNSHSDPPVLSLEELERKYGRHAEAMEQIHREFPYDYDTCHAWLVEYNGDQQEVLRYFKINTLVSFTHKSEQKCGRALDLNGMDLQRAANHLITSD